MSSIPRKYLMIISILLLIFLIWKLGERTLTLSEFPLEIPGDLSSYMGKLHFLNEYGYHGVVPNWYNGNYKLFLFDTPGWAFFTYPFLLLTNSIETATAISFFMIVLVALLACLYLGRIMRLKALESVTLFALVFGNPLAIGNLIRLGRPHEFLGWSMLVFIFALTLKYKEKKLDMHSLWIIPLYGITLLTHEAVFIMASFSLLSLFIVKRFDEKIKLILVMAATAIATAFWWLPFIMNIKESSVFESEFLLSRILWKVFDKSYIVDNATSFLISLAFLVLAFMYLKEHKKDRWFFLPQIFLGMIFFFRIVPLIPIINNLYVDIFNVYLIIYSAYFLFRIDFGKMSKISRKVIHLGLVTVVILSIAAYLVKIPGAKYNGDEEHEVMELLEDVHGRFYIFGLHGTTSHKKRVAYYSYAAIYHNLSTPSGWFDPAIEPSYIKKVYSLNEYASDKNCEGFTKTLEELQTENVIGIKEWDYDACDFLKHCGYSEKLIKEHSCLYRLK
jgi:hypothetical protein